jgi:hypothetical protein
MSHHFDKQRMPACSFFQRGVCTNSKCPYLHVRVNPNADVCQKFLDGFCPNGSKCKLKHILPRKNEGNGAATNSLNQGSYVVFVFFFFILC